MERETQIDGKRQTEKIKMERERDRCETEIKNVSFCHFRESNQDVQTEIKKRFKK